LSRFPVKRSKTITLVLVTSALFLGCERELRNQYDSLEDCVKDYEDQSKCSTETRSGGYFYYYGPWYRSSEAYNRQSNPSFNTRRASGVVRGGFGFTGFHSAS
jgi:hypothetical protein